MTNILRIPYNKVLIGSLSALWVLAAALGTPTWIREARTYGTRAGNLPFLLLAICLVVFLYYLVRRLLLPMFLGQPALELSPEGLQDNIKGIRVTWENVTGFSLIRVGRGSNFIRVDLRDNQAFLDQVDNPVRSWLYKLRQNMTGSPFVIPTTLLKGGDGSILEALEAYKQEMHDHPQR